MREIPIHTGKKSLGEAMVAVFDFGQVEKLKEENYPSHEQASGRSDREDLHKPGAKDDAEKVQVGLMLRSFPNALWAVAEVSTYGAHKKYSPFGFLKVEDPDNRYFNAEARHMLKELMGDEIDDETSYLHHAHKIWNDLARLEIRIRKEKENVTTSSPKIP